MTSAQPVEYRPSSRHSTRCVPPGDDDLDVARGAAVPIAATAAAQAPVPDASVGPTPRSQIRMRTRSGASTSASSTFVPVGKMRVDRQRRGDGMQPLLGHLAEHDALRVADAKRDRRRRARRRRRVVTRRYAPAAPWPRGTCSAAVPRRAASRRFDAGVGVNLDRRLTSGSARSRQSTRPGSARRCRTPPRGCRPRSTAASTRPRRVSV